MDGWQRYGVWSGGDLPIRTVWPVVPAFFLERQARYRPLAALVFRPVNAGFGYAVVTRSTSSIQPGTDSSSLTAGHASCDGCTGFDAQRDRAT
ncbi:hypothetical protein D3C85_1023280 [compost metagenome]